jgi:hypothetical protein
MCYKQVDKVIINWEIKKCITGNINEFYSAL